MTLRVLACAALAAAAGCAPPETPKADVGYHLAGGGALRGIGRVVFVEMGCPARHPEMSRHVTAALYEAIQAKRLFHVDVVSRETPACRDLALSKIGPLTLQELSEMRQSLDCDAVLVGRVTTYAPHPRMRMGLYLSLLDLRDGRVVWGIDHVWNAADKSVERRLKWHFSERLRNAYGPAGWRLATMSPRAFAKFVAAEVADTLSPPPATGQTAAAGRGRRAAAPHDPADHLALKKLAEPATMTAGKPDRSCHAY
jgi:hypothetical protein